MNYKFLELLVAFVTIICIVFVEDIEVFNKPLIQLSALILLILTIFLIREDDIAIGLLLITLFILIIARYFKSKNLR